MDLNEYKNILEETILNEYPVYFQKSIIQMLEERKIVFNDKRRKNNENLLDLTRYTKEKEKLKAVFNETNNIVKCCEYFEYIRAYRYCAIFRMKNFDKNIINDLIKSKKVIQVNEDIDYNDILEIVAYKPTYKQDENYIYLKFNFVLNNREDNFKKIKYPVLVIINKDMNIFEIRLDTISFKYKDNENFYKDKIGKVNAWVVSYLKCQVLNIDFQAITRYMKNEKKDDVTIVALKMKRDGTIAFLDSASNDEMIIPILGELKNIVSLNKELFNKTTDTIKIKTIIEDFISEVEETSDLPSVKILWHKEKIKLLAMHGYKEEDYSLFKYSDELGDKERMDYVTKYFIECEKQARESIGLK
ncbi:hypothetical protein FDC02_05170 [Clostridium botulinum]|nr:hypothetical protein [Clostridium botulinum]